MTYLPLYAIIAWRRGLPDWPPEPCGDSSHPSVPGPTCGVATRGACSWQHSAILRPRAPALVCPPDHCELASAARSVDTVRRAHAVRMEPAGLLAHGAHAGRVGAFPGDHRAHLVSAVEPHRRRGARARRRRPAAAG